MTMPGHGVELEYRTMGRLDLPGEEIVFVTADLVYRPADCLAVNLRVRVPGGPNVGWTFSWEMLAKGLSTPAGEGDVKIRPMPGSFPLVEISLAGRFRAQMIFSAREVGYFVERVRAVAPRDFARIVPDLEAELAAITGAE